MHEYSANLSKAAWGAYDKYENKLFIRSYELGVLFLPKFYGDDADKCSFDLKTNSKFTLPYDLPPVKYDSNGELLFICTAQVSCLKFLISYLIRKVMVL